MKNYNFEAKHMNNKIFKNFCEQIKNPDICVLDGYQLQTASNFNKRITIIEWNRKIYKIQSKSKHNVINADLTDYIKNSKKSHNCYYLDFETTFYGSKKGLKPIEILKNLIQKTRRKSMVISLTFCNRNRLGKKRYKTIIDIVSIIRKKFNINKLIVKNYRGINKINMTTIHMIIKK